MKNIALITGANSWLGTQIISQLASEGWGVIAASNDAKTDDENPDVFPVAWDVNDQALTMNAVAAGLSRFGRIDALINVPNVDVSRIKRGDFGQAAQEIFQNAVADSLQATLALLPLFRRQGYGAITQVVMRTSAERAGTETSWQIVHGVAAKLSASLNDFSSKSNIGICLSKVQLEEMEDVLKLDSKSNICRKVIDQTVQTLGKVRQSFIRGAALSPQQYRWLYQWQHAA